MCVLRSKMGLLYTTCNWFLFFLIQSTNLCLLISKFNPLSFKIITDRKEPTSAILLIIFCIPCSFFLSLLPVLLLSFVFHLCFCNDKFWFPSHLWFIHLCYITTRFYNCLCIYFYQWVLHFHTVLCYGGLYSFQAERLPPSEKKIKNLILHYFIHTKMTEILKSDNSKFWWRYTTTGPFIHCW